MSEGGRDAETREITNYLIVDWDSGSTRTRKSEPSASDLGPRELATELNLDIIVPEVTMPELHATVEVPQPRVESAQMDDLDAEDAPDWHDIADEFLAREPEADVDDTESLALDVIEAAPGRPEVRDVVDYLRRELTDRGQR